MRRKGKKKERREREREMEKRRWIYIWGYKRDKKVVLKKYTKEDG